MKLVCFSFLNKDRPSISVLYWCDMRWNISNRRTFMVSLLLLYVVGLSPLAAAKESGEIAWNPGVTLTASYYGAIPISDSLREQEKLPMRSQMNTQLDLAPLSFRFGRLTLSGELWLRYTSRSIYWGDTFYRPFWSVGPAVTFHVQCTDVFGMQFGGAGLYCFNAPVHQAFAAMDILVAPTVRFRIAAHNWLSVVVPVRMQIRNDILGVQVGVGVKWNYDTFSASSQPEEQEAW
ncbi:MAG: hypothetical protein SPD11_00075 [Sphaerochaetaceae bacterium]|nr:hypothetical protein [Sphaerochaetaceae bacterium]